MQVERLKGSYFFKNDEGYEQARTGDPYLTPFPSLSRFFVCPPPFQEMMRLCLSWEDDSDIVLGVGRLFVGNVPERFPAAIVIAKCKEDVQVAVQYAKGALLRSNLLLRAIILILKRLPIFSVCGSDGEAHLAGTTSSFHPPIHLLWHFLRTASEL